LLLLAIGIPWLVVAAQFVYDVQLPRPDEPIHHTVGHVFLALTCPVLLTINGILLLLNPLKIISPQSRRDYFWRSIANRRKHLESMIASRQIGFKSRQVEGTRSEFILSSADSRRMP
jgi:hypothetical protein